MDMELRLLDTNGIVSSADRDPAFEEQPLLSQYGTNSTSKADKVSLFQMQTLSL